MARTRTIYACQGCGNTSHKWLGKCPDCGGWNTFVEEKVEPERKSGGHSSSPGAPPRPISTLNMAEEDRFSTGISELDRVLEIGRAHV